MKKPLKRAVGRPKGEAKEPVNIFLKKTRAESLRNKARENQDTISKVVDLALEAAGI